ncbi:MAG: cytochrome c assembly protein [Saprospirales bacterium]|nr:MAG: cytochrome c assembly protein [Saprospirales bacterium]
MEGFRKHWYKWLSVVILVYVIAAGMLVPLRPGLMKTDAFNIQAGESHELTVQSYNTFYSRAENHRAWLRLHDEFTLLASEIVVVDDRHIEATFDIPEKMPTSERVAMASLIVDTDYDGSMVLPAAVSIIGQEGLEADPGPWLVEPIRDLSHRWTWSFPWRNILEETIRNTYYHVPMWFGMMLIFLLSSFYAVKLLRTGDQRFDSRVYSLNLTGTVLGLLGIFTGAIWARYTWGSYWSGDIKQDMAAITLLIFMAYFLLREAMSPGVKRGRVTAVYTLFAFLASIPLLYIIPRMQPSLHPGSGGNPGFGGDDLDNTMKTVFYPAIIGWTLFSYWISNVVYRLSELKKRSLDKNYS